MTGVTAGTSRSRPAYRATSNPPTAQVDRLAQAGDDGRMPRYR
ncbi:hypothetical protein AB0M45_20980 [Nocardia sp. NPDC051787]